MRGIAIGGLAAVIEGTGAGLSLGGLASVSEGASAGFALSGIATVFEGNHTGIAASGGLVICDKDLRGLSVGAIALPARIGESAKRWSFPGIRARNLSGLTVHGMNIQARERASGICVSGIHLSADVISGLSVAPIVRAGDLKGIVAGAVNSIARRQSGIAVGLVNRASVLKGIQIGLLNYAGNNPRGLRLLPIINVHLK
jgi:hypothetical protein